MIPGGGSNPDATFRVRGSGTYIAVSGRQPAWVKHSYQRTEQFIKRGTAKDTATMSFTAPSNVTTFSATADVEMTNCYNAGRLCETTPTNAKDSVVGSRIVVMQRAVSNAPTCTRDFRIKVRASVVSGNDVMIEADRYTNVFVKT